jgi:hypothetical protein
MSVKSKVECSSPEEAARFKAWLWNGLRHLSYTGEGATVFAAYDGKLPQEELERLLGVFREADSIRL